LHSERALKARLNARLNRAFSAGLCIYGLPWGVASGSDEHRAFGAKGTRAGTHARLTPAARRAHVYPASGHADVARFHPHRARN
jgi:hypothetical protein